MPISPFRAIRTLVIVVAAAAVLAGCTTPSGLLPAGPPVGEPAPSASPEESVEAPTPAVDLECSELVTESGLATALREPVALRDSVEYYTRGQRPDTIRRALRQVGGFACEWSNGEPGTNADGFIHTNPEYVGVTFSVLPDAESAWPRFAEYYGATGTRYPHCYEDLGTTFCDVNALVDDRWIDANFEGVGPAGTSLADAQLIAERLFDEAVSSVGAAPVASDNWTPPEDTIPIGRSCDQFFSAEDVQSALGVSAPLILDSVDGGESLVAASWRAAATWPCPWGDGSMMVGYGFGSWLAGGEWGWNETKDLAEAGTYEDFLVPGLGAGDSASISCADDESECTVDLIVGHNWIELSTNTATGGTAPIRDALLELATLTVGSIRG